MREFFLAKLGKLGLDASKIYTACVLVEPPQQLMQMLLMAYSSGMFSCSHNWLNNIAMLRTHMMLVRLSLIKSFKF